MPRKLTAIVLLSLVLIACGPASGPLEPRIDLLQQIPERDRVLEPGTSLRFGFAVPERGRLVLEARTEGAAASLGETRLQLEIMVEGQRDSRRVQTPDVADRVEVDLDASLDELVRLDVGWDAPDDGPRLRIETLRVDGTGLAAARASYPRAPYNVLLIVLDSLRADHLTPYGAGSSETPHLAELARRGVVFETARTNATWTRPSVVTMFSSRYPWDHGVVEPDSIFPEELPYLPELLARAGYRTEGASANDMVSALFGMSHGFDHLYSLRKSPVYRKSRDPRERARFVWNELLDELTSQPTPFFAYLHQLDPHSPYRPAAEYRNRYLAVGDGRVEASVEDIRHLRMRAGDLDDEQIDTLARLYKGEVAFMDDYVGELLRQLEIRELTNNTLIVFTSDHGEEFYEHESLGHGHTVYEELLKVPLIMRLDGVLPAGARIQEPVALLDLAPTILDLLGQPVPASMQGRSLLHAIEVPGATAEQADFASSGRPLQYAIRHGRWKLVRRDAEIRNTATRFELYDLVRDPSEQENLADAHPVATFALAQMLERQLRLEIEAGRPPVPRAKIDPETLEALKAIGYLER